MRLPSSSGVLAWPDPKTTGQRILVVVAIAVALWLLSGIELKLLAKDLLSPAATTAAISTQPTR